MSRMLVWRLRVPGGDRHVRAWVTNVQVNHRQALGLGLHVSRSGAILWALGWCIAIEIEIPEWERESSSDWSLPE